MTGAPDPLAAFGVPGWLRRFAAAALRLAGWKTEGEVPLPPRFVLICAPHTTNWDGFLLVLGGLAFGIRIQWFVKHTWFWWPMSAFLRFTGGFPIDRRRSHGVVAQVVERFKGGEPLIVGVAPEGTRRLVPHWKLGFYHIAREAGVPLVLGYIDYKRKVTGLGPAIVPGGDVAADFVTFREFYSKVAPRHPATMSPIEPPPPEPA